MTENEAQVVKRLIELTQDPESGGTLNASVRMNVDLEHHVHVEFGNNCRYHKHLHTLVDTANFIEDCNQGRTQFDTDLDEE